MSISISLAIPHTPWKPERIKSFSRLQTSLFGDWGHGVAPYRLFDEKCANHVWSEKMWAWSAAQDVTHCLFLQDDAIVAPDFKALLITMIKALPDEVIGLQVAHPAATLLAEEGHPWFTTADALVGVAYCVPRGFLEGFVDWRSRLSEEQLTRVTEDTLLGAYCAIVGKKIYHPLPTIVDHDVMLESTYGNDAHANRRSRVRWDTHPEGDWFGKHYSLTGRSRATPHMGCFYASTPQTAAFLGADESAIKRLRLDTGRRETARLNYARMGRGELPKARLFLATPHQGHVSAQYHQSVCSLLRDETFEMVLADMAMPPADVCKARNRLIHHFVHNTDATHILFVDSDISFKPQAIRGMLASGKDFVSAPYPRRDHVLFDRAAQCIAEGVPPEAGAYAYPFKPLGGEVSISPDGLCEIEAIGFGCVLLTRKCAEEMLERYGRPYPMREWIDNLPDPEWGKTARKEYLENLVAQSAESLTYSENGETRVGVFNLLVDIETGNLCSEDFSFCKRWRAMGGNVWLYLGVGSPVNHTGSWTFRGTPEAFGVKHG